MVSAVAAAAITLAVPVSNDCGYRVIGGLGGLDITFGNNAWRKFARGGSTRRAVVNILCVENHK